MNKDEKLLLLGGAAVTAGIFLMGSGSGVAVPAGRPATPSPPVFPPTQRPIQENPPAGWIQPLPNIRLDKAGVRTDGNDPAGREFKPVVSNPYAPSKGHEGVDIDYRRGSAWSQYRGTGSGVSAQAAAAGYPMRETPLPVSFPSNPLGLLKRYSDSHDGTENYFCPPQVLCCAVQAGRVWTAVKQSSRGMYVLIDHGSYTTYYTHLSSITMPECAGGFIKGTTTQYMVARGQALGIVGYDPSTKTSTVRHLHFQLATRVAGVMKGMDPAEYLRNAQEWRA